MQAEAGAPLSAEDPIQTTETRSRRRPLPPTDRRRLVRILGLIAVLVYAADQLTKAWAVAALTDRPVRNLIGDWIRLELIRNPGAAFSMGTGSTWVLSIIAIVVLVVIARTARRLGSVGWAIALGMLLGGAFGNLTDRIVREPGVFQGHVVDFIAYFNWFIGNVADIAIVAAAMLIAVLSIRGTNIDGSRHHGGKPTDG